MRKIKSMADIEKARRRNNIILGLVMIALLVGSSLGYSLMSSSGESKDVKNENGFDFVRDGGLWKLMINDKIFGFNYLPSEVEGIESNLSLELGTYSGKVLYFVNPNEGAGEILSNVGDYILRNQEACFSGDIEKVNNSNGNFTNVSNVDCEGNLPIKDCESNLIVFRVGSESEVYNEGNCVFIVGDSSRGSDLFLYKILGIL